MQQQFTTTAPWQRCQAHRREYRHYCANCATVVRCGQCRGQLALERVIDERGNTYREVRCLLCGRVAASKRES